MALGIDAVRIWVLSHVYTEHVDVVHAHTVSLPGRQHGHTHNFFNHLKKFNYEHVRVRATGLCTFARLLCVVLLRAYNMLR